MKIVNCKCGAEVLLDDSVYESLPKKKIHCSSNTCYIWIKKQVVLARLVTGQFDTKLVVDHKSSNYHDNRIANLRVCEYFWNSKNRSRNSRNTSGLIGARYHKQSKKWKTYATTLTRGVVHLGYFDCPIRAGRARDRVVEDEFGAFARLNFPHDYTRCDNRVP